MLRSDGERLGLKPNFSILDSDDVLGVLKDAGGTTDNALARRWQWAIGGWKNRGLDAAGAAAEVASGGVSGDERSAADALVAARVMERYQERLAAYQAVDFDDLIVLPAKLLARDAEVRDAWRERLRYVLVDEYQDTNGVQYELMKLLAGERGHLHRGRRRRPEHLRLARRDPRQPEAPAGRLSGAEGDPARAELPLDRQHPARRQRGDRQQPEALREEALERARQRRPGRA